MLARNKAQIAEMAKKYKSGTSIKELALEYHHSATTIRKYLHEAGVELRKVNWETQVARDQIWQMYQNGASIMEIVMETGRSECTVKEIIKFRKPIEEEAVAKLPNIKFANVKVPRAHRVVYNGKRYLDVTEFWGM